MIRHSIKENVGEESEDWKFNSRTTSPRGPVVYSGTSHLKPVDYYDMFAGQCKRTKNIIQAIENQRRTTPQRLRFKDAKLKGESLELCELLDSSEKIFFGLIEQVSPDPGASLRC